MLFFLSCYFFKPYFFIFTSQVFDYISWSKFIEVYPVWDLLSFFSTFVYFSKNFKVLSCPFLPRFSQFQHLFLIPGLRWQSFNSVAVVPGYLGATHCPLWASDVSCFLASASPTFLFFWFFSPSCFELTIEGFWMLLLLLLLLVVITLVFCFKLFSWYSFTLSVDEEPPVQFAFEDIFFPCDVALVFVESSCCLCHLDICAWPSVLPHTFSLLLDESWGVNGDWILVVWGVKSWVLHTLPWLAPLALLWRVIPGYFHWTWTYDPCCCFWHWAGS